METHPNDTWAADHSLDAILGPHGRDVPEMSSAGQLNALLDAIDASPEIRRLLEMDDPDSAREMLSDCREMADDLMTAVLLVHPHDTDNLGYQAAAAVESEIRAKGIHMDDELIIHRQDHGTGKGYCLTHYKADGGLDYWEFDENGEPVA